MYNKLFTGPMFAGKTRRLVHELEKFVLAKKHVAWFEPKRDTRGGSHSNFITQRMEELKNSECVNSYNFSDPNEIIQTVLNLQKRHVSIACIFIDEYFMVPFTKQFFYDYQNSGLKDIPMVFAGLTVGWDATMLATAAIVIPFMDEINKEDAICMKCGKPANYYYYKGGLEAWNAAKDPIDNGQCYEVLCHDCYIKETKKPIESTWK